MNKELYHHGVKGMKWGIRKDHKRTKPSTRKKKLTTKQKVAIGVGVAATVAVGAYFAKRYIDMNGDKIIKAGSDIQHMAKVVDENLNRPFYASHIPRDNKAYAKADFLGANWHYKKTLVSNKDVKIAGKKAAIDTFTEWINTDPKAKEIFEGTIKRSDINSAYFKFNRNFISPDRRDRELRDSYFKALAEKGYDAVRDVNDQHMSDMISPIMIFGSLGEMSIKDLQEVIK